MNRIADRKRRRREFLCKRLGGQLAQGAFLVAFIPVFIVAFALWVAFAFALFGIIVFVVHGGEASGALFWLAVLLGAAVMASFGCRFCWRRCDVYEQRVRDLPYVPPVTIENLPAEETLVRGATAPGIEQDHTLLRAAAGHETSEENLLRASQNDIH